MVETELRENLRTLSQAYLARRPYAATTLWARATKEARFMDRLEGGKTFTVRKYDRTVQWFSNNWPEGAEWPESVPRPKTTSRRRRPNQTTARF